MSRSSSPPITRVLDAMAPIGDREDERELARRIVRVLGETPGVRCATFEESVFAARVERLQTGLDEVTDGFMHDIGRASTANALSDETYVSLVQDLDRKKRAVVARVLASILPPK